MQNSTEEDCAVVIRVEEEHDYRAVEEMTREAFWNLHGQGAVQHYLLHKLRQSECFIPALSLVATINSEIVGHIAYSRSEIIQVDNSKTEVITFGPISVSKEHQGKGIGSLLIRQSIILAYELGHKAVVILGYPCYYDRFGFQNAYNFNIRHSNGKFVKSLMVLELVTGSLQGTHGYFRENSIFDIDCKCAEFTAFDSIFPEAEMFQTVSQACFNEMVQLTHQDPDPVDLTRRCFCRNRIKKDIPS